jgi:hypothetical protein
MILHYQRLKANKNYRLLKSKINFELMKDRLWYTCRQTQFCLLLTLAACVAPDPVVDLSVEDKDLYITNRDVSVNFANYKTYAIVDSVVTINKNSSDTIGHKSSFSTQILNDVNFELQKDGFVQVGKTQNPDVGVNVSVLRFTEEVPAGYFTYTQQGTGYSGYQSTAFWGYPGYTYGIPNYFGYYRVDVGSISIEMIDLKSAAANPGNNTLNVIWSALIAGSVTDSTLISNSRIGSAIAASFNQSPYLHEGK